MKKFIFFLWTILMIHPLIAQEKMAPVYPYAEKGKWGAIDKSGKILIKPKYKEISVFVRSDESNALATVTDDEGLQGAINRKGKLAAKIQYKFVDLDGKGDYLIVRNTDGLYGLVKTKNKKELLKTEYKMIKRFRGAKLGVSIIQKQDGKYGAINDQGKIIAEPIYKKAFLKDAYGEYPDVKLIKEDDSSLVLDGWGEPVKKNKDRVGDEDDEMVFEDMMIEEAPPAPAPPSSHTRMIEVDGQKAIEFTTAYNGKTTPGKDTIVGIDQVVKIYHRYQSGRGYCVDYVIVKKDGKIGILNYDSEILTPIEYDRIAEKGGRNYFELIKDGKKGVADRKGKLFFDAQFDAVKLKAFDPIYLVKIGQYEGYADKTGHVYLPEKAFE